MSRNCRTCQHLKRPEIDRRLAAGEPVAQVARDHEINPSSLHRHKTNCLKLGSSNQIMKAAAQRSAAIVLLPSKENLSSAYGELRARIDFAISGLNSIRHSPMKALATGLKGRIAEMQDRLDRLQDCAAKRRHIARDVMVELDLKKITAPDFTVWVRPGMPSLLVLDEAAVPSIYWEPREPRLNRQGLANDLKQGAHQRRYPLQSRTGFERED